MGCNPENNRLHFRRSKNTFRVMKLKIFLVGRRILLSRLDLKVLDEFDCLRSASSLFHSLTALGKEQVLVYSIRSRRNRISSTGTL